MLEIQNAMQWTSFIVSVMLEIENLSLYHTGAYYALGPMIWYTTLNRPSQKEPCEYSCCLHLIIFSIQPLIFISQTSYPNRFSHKIIISIVYTSSCHICFDEQIYIGALCGSMCESITKNIERHTADTIVSWPNPKQWVIFHTNIVCLISRIWQAVSLVNFIQINVFKFVGSLPVGDEVPIFIQHTFVDCRGCLQCNG